MAIYERRTIRKRSDAHGKDVGHPVSQVSAFFRRPERGETAKKMREKKRRFPVHPEEIRKAELKERDDELRKN